MSLKFLRMEVLHPTYSYKGNSASNTLSSFNVRLTYGVEANDLKQFGIHLKSLSNQGQTLATDDKVYFTPWSEVPRYKFNEYARDKPRLSRVITFNKATAIVVDPDKILPSVSGNSYTYAYYRFPKTVLQLNTGLVTGLKYNELSDYVYLRDTYIKDFQTLVPFNSSLLELISVHEYWSYTDATAIEEKIEIANELLTTTKKLISDTVLLEEINQGVHVTPEVYDQLCNMLYSTDAQNTALAMELMANADYKKSEFKIALLLNKFSSRIMNHKNASLVNFRSLLSYFNKYNWRSDPIAFSESIIKNANSTMVDYQERLTLVKKSLLDHVNHMFEGGIFSVNEVVVNYSPRLKEDVEAVEEVGELEE